MKACQETSELTLSATDLSGFSECEHKTTLDLAVALGRLDRPGENEIERKMLEKRGFEHEARVLEHLQATRQGVVKINAGPGDASRVEAALATEQAMRDGADVIAQGVLSHQSWFGRPDFLLKIPGESRFGAHSYVVADAKLANEAKARAVLQLCAYSELLHEAQGGQEPELFYIAPGGAEVKLVALRTADYSSYYRLAKQRFEAFVADAAERTVYPEPVEHCGVCGWWKRCENRRRSDDHLSLVAGITARQRDRLSTAGVTSVAELGALSRERPMPGIAKESLVRVREQARLQIAGRSQPKPLYELLLDVEPTFGLDRLPLPKPGDLFLDLEGDPFVQGTGLEYLFGLVELGDIVDDFIPRDAPGAPRYHAFWSKNRAEEKRAFEAVIDRIFKGRDEFADLHVFHFGHREADALKTLSCRHKTRENQVDQLTARARVDRSARHRETQPARVGRKLHTQAARRPIRLRAQHRSALSRPRHAALRLAARNRRRRPRRSRAPLHHRALQPRRLPIDLPPTHLAGGAARRIRAENRANPRAPREAQGRAHRRATTRERGRRQTHLGASANRSHARHPGPSR